MQNKWTLWLQVQQCERGRVPEPRGRGVRRIPPPRLHLRRQGTLRRGGEGAHLQDPQVRPSEAEAGGARVSYSVPCVIQEQRLPGGDAGERRGGPAALRFHVRLPQHPEPGAEAQEGEVTVPLCGGHGLSLRYGGGTLQRLRTSVPFPVLKSLYT